MAEAPVTHYWFSNNSLAVFEALQCRVYMKGAPCADLHMHNRRGGGQLVSEGHTRGDTCEVVTIQGHANG